MHTLTLATLLAALPLQVPVRAQASRVPIPASSPLTVGGQIPKGVEVLSEQASPPFRFSATGLTVRADGSGWGPAASLPMPLGFAGASAAELDGKLYVAGGSDGFTQFNTLLCYDPDVTPPLGSWSVVPDPMPTPRANAAVVATGGYLYVIGGSNPAALGTVERWSPGSGWQTGLPSIAPRQALVAQAIGGKIYAIGGYNASLVPQQQKTVQVYDPSVGGSWTTLPDMPTARYTMGSAVLDGIIYVVGGGSPGNGFETKVEAYDTVNNTWSTLAPLSVHRCCTAAAAANGRIYVISGEPSAGALNASVEEYDPATNTWSPSLLIPTPRDYLSAGVLGGRIYAIGGRAGPALTVTATVEVLDPGRTLFVHRKD